MIIGLIVIFYLSSVFLTRSVMISSMKNYKVWYAPETWYLPLINLILVCVLLIRRIDLDKSSIYKWWTGGM